MTNCIELLMKKQKRLYYEYLVAKGNISGNAIGDELEVRRLYKQYLRVKSALEEIENVILEDKN